MEIKQLIEKIKYPVYYTDKDCALLNGGSAIVLKQFPDNCIDLTCTSPPYDQLRTYKGFTFDFETIAKELYRVTKEGGVVAWIVGDATIDGSETGTSFRQALEFMRVGFNLHDTMIYLKSGFANPSTNRYHQVFEYMFILSKSKLRTFNPIKDRKNLGTQNWGVNNKRQADGSLKEHKQPTRGIYGARYNVWEYDAGKGLSTSDEIAHEHPAIYPEQLAKDHILSWSNEGDTVLDCFSGSGTTLKAAKLLKRNSIGIEIAKEYCELTVRRINKPMPLFNGLTTQRWH